MTPPSVQTAPEREKEMRMSCPNYLSEEEVVRLVAEVVKVLNGVPIIQAVHILEEAKGLAMDTQLVDSSGLRHRQKLAELGLFSPE